jgi:hypothetical protein
MNRLRVARLGLLAGTSLAAGVLGHAEEKKREAALVSVTDTQLREGISARAGRNYAWMGYNTPEIHLQLPPVDNSAYADVTFEPAKLLDKGGRAVPYELEQGLYEPETHRTEIRFTPKEAKPDAPPVEFARAVGKIRVRYPAAARTVTVKPGAPVAVNGAKVSVKDSSVVMETQPGWKMLEAPFGSDLDAALRVVDASGRRLEEDQSKYMSESLAGGAGERATRVFKGKVAQARLEVVDEWAEVELSYDLPPFSKLPAADAGTRPAGGDEGGPAVRPATVRRLPKVTAATP